MGRFFNMDNKFFTFMGRIADLCILNIICLVCCIPIVTAGASITAMYYVTLKMVRNEEAYIVRSFFKSFKDNFKQATVINLIMIAVGVVLYLDLNVAKNMPGSAGQIFYVIFMAFVIISYQIQSTLFVLFLIMGFGVIAYCNSFFLVKIFDHYMPKEENEEQKSEGTEV